MRMAAEPFGRVDWSGAKVMCGLVLALWSRVFASFAIFAVHAFKAAATRMRPLTVPKNRDPSTALAALHSGRDDSIFGWDSAS